MSKRGLYIEDDTKHLFIEGYANPSTDKGDYWKRSLLGFNDSIVGKAVRGTHATGPVHPYGLYVSGNDLCLNDDVVATAASPGTIIPDGGSLRYGNHVIYSDNKCIDITKSNYNLLRSGKAVAGYAKYSPEIVYHIVPDTITDPNYETPSYDDKVLGHEDIIWNSFDGSLPHNPLNEATVFNLNTPECVVRIYDFRIKKGQCLNLEYFVDTKEYASTNKFTIDDTFTVIITDREGRELYKNTTYAGVFKIKTTEPFVDGNGQDFVGATWFRIQCIDNHGVGSIEYSLPILIEELEEKPLYNVQYNDLTDETKLGEDMTLTLADTDDYAACYKNLKGLDNLIKWVSAQVDGNGERLYGGVRLFNPEITPDLTLSKENKSAITYCLDTRPNNGTESSPEPGDNDYYLVKVVIGTNNTLSLYSVDDEGTETLITPSVNGYNYDIDDFSDAKIVKNKVFMINGVSRTVSSDDPFDFVRWDGAHIFRNNYDDICVRWPADMQYQPGNKEVYVNPDTGKYLKVVSIKTICAYLTDGHSNSSVFNTLLTRHICFGDGYYYLSYFNGESSSSRGDANKNIGITMSPLPDNFTLDLNGTILKLKNREVIHTGAVLRCASRYNVKIKNGIVIDGNAEKEGIRSASLKQAISGGGGTWEGAQIIDFPRSRFCCFENLKLIGALGYGVLGGHLNRYDHSTSYGTTSLNFTVLGAKDFFDQSEETFFKHDVITDGGVLDINSKAGTSQILGDDEGICIVTSNTINISSIDSNLTAQLPNDKVIYVASSKDNFNCYGGTAPLFFVNFYGSNNRLVKTIKTGFKLPVAYPSNAVKFEVVAYGVCSGISGTHSIVTTGSPSKAKFLEYMVAEHCHPSAATTLDRVVMRDFRSGAFSNTCMWAKIKDCVFSHIADNPVSLALTRAFSTNEEADAYSIGTYIEGCDFSGERYAVYGYKTAQSVLTQNLTRNITLRNCRVLGFKGPTMNLLVDNCILGNCEIDCSNSNNVTRFNAIVKNSIVPYMEYAPNVNGQTNYADTGGWFRANYKELTSGTNISCPEQVQHAMSVEDSFLAVYYKASSPGLWFDLNARVYKKVNYYQGKTVDLVINE